MAPFARRPPLLQRPCLLALAGGVAGFAVNGFAFPVFGGTSLVFGGFFSLLSAFTFGPWCGALTALVAFSRTLADWQHPAGLVCFTLEAFVSGWLIRRRGWRQLTAVGGYWLFLGFPLVATWMVGFGHYPFPSDWAIALKYPVNGILMGLAALLAHHLVIQRWPSLAVGAARRPMSLRQLLFQRFGVIAALPIAALSLLSGHSFDQTRRDEITADVARWVDDVSRVVRDHLDQHRRIIATVAREFSHDADASPEEFQREIDSVRQEYHGFLTLLVADEHGRVIAASDPAGISPGSLPAAARDVSDRDYFRQAVATRRSYISNVFQGRGLGRDLIVAVSAPVVDPQGRVRFVVEGSLDLSAIATAITDGSVAQACDLVLVDRQQRVVFARGFHGGLKPLAPFIGNALYDDARRAADRTLVSGLKCDSSIE